MVLDNALRILNEVGLLTVALPFALIFILVYTAARGIPQLKENPRIRVVLATVVSLLVIIPSVTKQGTDILPFLFTSIPLVVLILILVLGVMLVMAATMDNFNPSGIVPFAVAAVVFIFLANFISPNAMRLFFDLREIQMIIIFLLIFAGIGWYVLK